MPQTNLETKNITLGRGDLYFAQRRANGTLGGERMLGNTPAFGLTMSSETLKHYNSARGVKTMDREVPVQTDQAGSFTTDDVNPRNLAMLFLGSTGLTTVAGAVGLTETFVDVEQGLTYQLGLSATHPAGRQKLTNVVVKVGVTTKTIVTDYTVDTDLGRVTIVEGGTIAADADVIVEYDQVACTQERTVSGSTVVEGALHFIAYNPEGADKDYYMSDVKLAPNGDFAIKADNDWQAMQFNVSISTPTDRAAITCNGRAFTA